MSGSGNGFDKIPMRDDLVVPPPPKDFLPVEVIAEKFAELHWPVDDAAWEWNVELMSDEELVRRFRNASAELEAQALTLTDDGHFVPREFSEKELAAGRALAHYWQTVCEMKIRKAVREALAAIAQGDSPCK